MMLFIIIKTVKIDIRIEDSYKIISMPLSEFPNAFKLEAVKEIMPYNEYTKENMSLKYWPVHKMRKVIISQYGENA